MIKNFFKDTVIYGMGVGIAKLLLFLSVPIFTGMMSVESYGIIGFIGSLIGLIGIVMKIGSNNAVQRYYFDVEEYHKKNVISSGLKILFGFSSLVLLVSLFFVFIFSDYFSSRGISHGVLLSAIAYIFFLQYIIFIKDVMRLYFRPWAYFYLEIAPILLSLFFAIVLIFYFNLQIEGYFIGYAIGTLIVLLLAFIFFKKEFYFTEQTRFKKELISFGYPFIFMGLASWVFQSSDRWMLLELSSVKDVGLYSVAYQISAILLLFVTTFGIVWSPYSMKLLRHTRHKEIYANVGTLWFLVLTYIAFIISLFLDDIIRLLLDERYYDSIEIALLLIITIITIGTVQISLMGIAIAKKTKILPSITWGVAVVNIGLNYFLIPHYSAFGAAIATLVSNSLLTLLYFKYSQNFYYIPYHKLKFLVIIILIILFYTLLLSSNILSFTLSHKIIVSLGLSILFGIWIFYEVQKLLLLVGHDEH